MIHTLKTLHVSHSQDGLMLEITIIVRCGCCPLRVCHICWGGSPQNIIFTQYDSNYYVAAIVSHRWHPDVILDIHD
jgi:hypothetical protein